MEDKRIPYVTTVTTSDFDIERHDSFTSEILDMAKEIKNLTTQIRKVAAEINALVSVASVTKVGNNE